MSNETLPHVTELAYANRLAAAGQPELPTVQSPNELRALLASDVAADCVRYRNERSDPWRIPTDGLDGYARASMNARNSLAGSLVQFDQNIHSEPLTTLLHAVYRYRGADYHESRTDPGWRLDGLEVRGIAVNEAHGSRSAVVAWAAADRDVQAAEKSGNRDEMRAAIGRRNEITEAAISEVNTTLAAVQVALDRPTE